MTNKHFFYINETLVDTIKKYAEKEYIKPEKLFRKDYLVVCYNKTGFDNANVFYAGKREEVINILINKFNETHADMASIEIISEHSSRSSAEKTAKKLTEKTPFSKLFKLKKIIKKIEYGYEFISA